MSNNDVLLPVPMEDLLRSIQAIVGAEIQRQLTPGSPKNASRVLTFAEACKYLGYSRSYLYKLTSAGMIPHAKPSGKRLFFDVEKLDEWLLSNSTTSLQEKKSKAATYVATKR